MIEINFQKLLATAAGSLVTGTIINPKALLDTLRDFMPKTQIYESAQVIVAKQNIEGNPK